MSQVDKIWLELPKYSPDYVNGIESFLENTFAKYAEGDQLRCPCRKCYNRKWHSRNVLYDHLIYHGPYPIYCQWIYEVSTEHKRSDAGETSYTSENNFVDDLNTMLNNAFRYLDDEVEQNESGWGYGKNEEAKKFYKFVEDGKQPLYPGCDKFSKLKFIIQLYHWKCTNGISEAAFSEILGFIREVFPFADVPKNFKSAKCIIKDLGLDYKKIHACPNDCMIYWGENEKDSVCKVCGSSRWIVKESNIVQTDNLDEKKSYKVPAKVIRYFPLIPRLQRLFMCKEYSELMVWHARVQENDGKLRHPADGKAWKGIDEMYPQFSNDHRNVRLGLASDGFNPFRTMSVSHSTWPIVLVNYNLPHWLSMKPENLILSIIIPCPNSPGNNIDVYMQPLIKELTELWDVGVETYDALTNKTFIMRACLLWTISGFPAYAMLSGWSTKGKLACPICHYETSSTYLKHSKEMCYMNHMKFLDPDYEWRFDGRRFNGEIEIGRAPTELSGVEIAELLQGYENMFGKQKKNQRTNGDIPWKKRSDLYNLRYWKHNVVRHNLDVMHIEKNICDNIIGTLLNIPGKTKDHLNACLDLQEMGIRKVLHPTFSSDGTKLHIRASRFDMTNAQKETFCSVLKSAKFPYGSGSNISRCVQLSERKVSGYKSHDANFMLQYLLKFAIKKTLERDVAIPLIKLGEFFRALCKKVIDIDDLKMLQADIVQTLCQFEMIFPPSFFDIMVHRSIHLTKEIEAGGPVHNRWMFFVERYLGKLKSYVRNRSKPGGSIAEGYLAEECLTFCSRYLDDGMKKNKPSTSTSSAVISKHVGYSIETRRNKNGKSFHLDEETWIKAHRYILFNSLNDEVEEYIEKHHQIFEGRANAKRYKRAQYHSAEFYNWFREEIVTKKSVTNQLVSLSKGPNRSAKRYSGYIINGYRFHNKKRDFKCTTQNSGVSLKALTTSFTSSKDPNPIVGNITYYGSIEEIIELDYWGDFNVVLFRCCWYQEKNDEYGFRRVNFNKLISKNDPFVLAIQVDQIFYIADPIDKGSHYLVEKEPNECPVGMEGEGNFKD